MVRLNIEIPDDLRSQIEARASESGDATVEAYVERLVRDDASTSLEFGAPAHLNVQSRQQLESMLVQATETPTREVTPEEWQQKKQQLADRMGRAKAG